VVDADGRCLGVVSATDFLRHAQDEVPRARPTFARESYAAAWQMVDEAALPHDTVAAYMTPDPVTTAPGASVGELARMMLDAHIHRVIVTDRQRRPVGIVSSMDILAAVAQADRQAAPGEYED